MTTGQDIPNAMIGYICDASAIASKFASYLEEQILSYSEDGILKIWVDKNANDNNTAILSSLSNEAIGTRKIFQAIRLI
jgi:hypothetical protein